MKTLTIFLIMLIVLCTSTFADVLVEYSEDNASWMNVTTVDTGKSQAYQINLIKDTTYFARGRNSTTDFTYLTFITKGAEQTPLYYIFIIIFVVFLVMQGLGHYLEEEVFIIISGMLLGIAALGIFTDTFINLTNVFLKQGMVMVLIGLSFYFIVAPGMAIIESWEDEI